MLCFTVETDRVLLEVAFEVLSNAVTTRNHQKKHSRSLFQYHVSYSFATFRWNKPRETAYALLRFRPTLASQASKANLGYLEDRQLDELDDEEFAEFFFSARAVFQEDQ